MRKISLLRFVSFAVIFINIFLIISKIWVYNRTASVSVFASLMDSIFDIIISSLNALVLFYAEKPKDDDHRFGHQAIEDVISLFQIFLIALASVWVFMNAIALDNTKYHFDWISLAVIVFNTIPIAVIIYLQVFAEKRSGSTIMKADLLHYSGDIITAMGVIFAMLCAYYFHFILIDIVIGGIIMVIVLKSCFHGAVQAFNNLMAKELCDGTREKIENILQNSHNIVGFKNLKTRRSGQVRFAQVDIIFFDDISLSKAHEIAHEIEDRIHSCVQNLDITIHLEPQN